MPTGSPPPLPHSTPSSGRQAGRLHVAADNHHPPLAADGRGASKPSATRPRTTHLPRHAREGSGVAAPPPPPPSGERGGASGTAGFACVHAAGGGVGWASGGRGGSAAALKMDGGGGSHISPLGSAARGRQRDDEPPPPSWGCPLSCGRVGG
ncbi:hypothetical protein I4F81_012371 [Pyropia yezoensis]|uniref:Uncharacterized protein n=1 Tax=Pyropia yezoensis TaxID=2788 RepID=A0ACC3CIQ4_PYRYE|nr:hypothetical protein I4F81_012371 [Neopyropia yezoensis]